MNCEHARLEAMDGRVNEHVRACAECAAFLEDWRKISGLLKSDEPAPRAMMERISSIPARPHRIRRIAIASLAAAAAALVIVLQMLIRPEPPPPPVADTSQFDAELEMIKREIDRIDLNAQVSKFESR
jgi:ferric-dicitrate binding protein FerR (iron transport regulator)